MKDDLTISHQDEVPVKYAGLVMSALGQLFLSHNNIATTIK